MKTIKGILRFFIRLKNAEHFNVNYSIIRYCNSNLGDIAALDNKLVTYNARFEEEDILFKRLSALEETSSLKELDRLRDDMFISFRYIIDASLYSHDAAIKEAGQALSWIMQNYKNANSKPYPENTALVINMLQDLERPEYAAHIKVLKAEETIAKLKKYNDDFALLYDERARHKEKKNEVPPLSAARTLVDRAAQGLFDSINALYLSNALETHDSEREILLEDAITTINGIIHQAQEVYYRRVRANRPKEDDDKPDPEDEKPFEPYTMHVTGQDDEFGLEIFDTNPEAFANFIATMPLEGADFFPDMPKEEEVARFFFGNYLEVDGKIKGFKLGTEAVLLGSGSDKIDTAVLIKNGRVIIHFRGVTIPITLD